MTDNVKSFERIYQDVSRDLFVYVARSVRDNDLAGDILQDSFINFMKAFSSRELPPDVNCRMYLFRIARHLIINNSRSSQNTKTTLYADPDAYVSSGSENLPEKEIMQKEETREVSSLLNKLLLQLSEEERTAVILKYMHDMKLQQIAEIMDTSISTASRLTQKGMEKLTKIAEAKGLNLSDLQGKGK